MNLLGGEIPTLFAAVGADGKRTSMAEDLMRSLENMRESAFLFVEKLIPAIILFVIGLLIAMVLSKATSIVLNKIGLDKMCERIGVSGILDRAGIKAQLSKILGKVLFYVLIIMFLMSAADSLGMPQFSEPLHGLVKFLPKIMIAAIIFMAGFIVSDVARGIVQKAGERMGLDFARPLASLIYAFLLVLVGTICMSTLGVDTTLIRHTVEITLVAGALAVALAMGLGMRPLTQDIIAGVYVRDNFKAGTRVRLTELGIDATVLAIGPVSTRLRSKNPDSDDTEDVVVPNHTMISNVVKASPLSEVDRADA